MAEYKNNETTAVAISKKAAELAKAEKERRFNDMGIKMTVGAVVSEAVFEAFGKNG